MHRKILYIMACEFLGGVEMLALTRLDFKTINNT